MIIMAGSIMVAGRHGAEAVAETLHPEAEKETWCGFLKPKSPATLTHLL